MKMEIMDRKGLEERAKLPFPPKTAVISITDSDREEVVLACQPRYLLRLQFDDVSQEIYEELLGRKPTVREMHKLSRRLRMFENRHARQIAAFLKEKPDSLICQCEWGQSRSAAVAAAILEYQSGRGIRIFADPRYSPNKLVYRKLLQTLRGENVP